MSDLDRFEEYSREMREAGGAYAPEYDRDVDRAEVTPLPARVRVPAPQHTVDRCTGVAVQVVDHGWWAPSWEPPENWVRTVTVLRRRDGQDETRVIEADRIEVRGYVDVVPA